MCHSCVTSGYRKGSSAPAFVPNRKQTHKEQRRVGRESEEEEGEEGERKGGKGGQMEEEEVEKKKKERKRCGGAKGGNI